MVLTRTVTVASASGLHARPAMLVTQAAAASGSRVLIARPSQAPVDASSILSVMALGIRQGDAVVVSSDDPAVLNTIADMLATDLDAR